MKDQPTTLAPKLRFPEFRDPWDEMPLRDLAVPVSDRVGMSDCVPYTVTSGIGLVSQDEKFGRTIAGKSLSNYIRLQKDDFAYNKSATKAFPEGYIARYQDDVKAAVPNSIFTCFRADPSKIDPAYLDFLFAGNLHGRWLRKFLTIGARAHGSLNVSDDDLMAIPVPMPSGRTSSAEQRKIAACLTSLDDLIAAEGRKLEALRVYKEGLMQQLFPREGESRPLLRFPEFRDAEEWGNEELSSCLDAVIDYRGKAPPKSQSGVPLITARNVRIGWLDMTEDEYIPENEYESWMCRGVPQSGDILFTTEAPLANVARFPTAGRFALGQRLLTLRADADKCLHDFLFQSLLGPRMQEEIHFRSTGSTAKGIKSSVFVTIGFCHPGLAEQQRIAACLSSLDALIAAQSRKLDGQRSHKKGLMQQLFPSLEGKGMG
jgi:type I restriction enzyme S subunit